MVFDVKRMVLENGFKTQSMKKPLLLFILLAILLVIGKMVYTKYCESNPEGCKNEKYKDEEESPREGIDW